MNGVVMRNSGFVFAAVPLLASNAIAKPAPPAKLLAPSGKWAVEYAKEMCVLNRAFGSGTDDIFALLRKSGRMILAADRRKPGNDVSLARRSLCRARRTLTFHRTNRGAEQQLGNTRAPGAWVPRPRLPATQAAIHGGESDPLQRRRRSPIRTNDGVKRFLALGLTPPMPHRQAA